MSNKLNLSPEALKKLRNAPSTAELLTLLQENGTEMTAQQAEDLFAKLHAECGAISDEELDSVAGGVIYAIGDEKTNSLGGGGRKVIVGGDSAKRVW